MKTELFVGKGGKVDAVLRVRPQISDPNFTGGEA